ncbi:unnamed protein product, partial [Ixodes hexagonus]
RKKGRILKHVTKASFIRSSRALFGLDSSVSMALYRTSLTMISIIIIAVLVQPLCRAQSTTTLSTSPVRDGTGNFTAPQATSIPGSASTTTAVPKTPIATEAGGVTVVDNFGNATISTTVRPSTKLADTSTAEVTRTEATTGTFMMPSVDALVANEAGSFSTTRDSFDSPTTTSVSEAWPSSEPSSLEMAPSTDGVVETSTVRSSYDPFAELVRVFLNPDQRSHALDYSGGLEDSEIQQDVPFYSSDSETKSENSGRKDNRGDGVSSTTEVPTYDMSKERYCTAARYCYKELNERCITRRMRTVCGCGRAFFRNPETLMCERKLPLITSLELPHQSYVQEVADKKSSEFKLFESASQQLVREEAEPLAFPPLASYEPDDQALWKLYDSDLSTTPQPATAVP